MWMPRLIRTFTGLSGHFVAFVLLWLKFSSFCSSSTLCFTLEEKHIPHTGIIVPSHTQALLSQLTHRHYCPISHTGIIVLSHTQTLLSHPRHRHYCPASFSMAVYRSATYICWCIHIHPSIHLKSDWLVSVFITCKPFELQL